MKNMSNKIVMKNDGMVFLKEGWENLTTL